MPYDDNNSTTWDKSDLPSGMSPFAASGRRTAPITSHGDDRGSYRGALIGIAACWNEAAPCNIA